MWSYLGFVLRARWVIGFQELTKIVANWLSCWLIKFSKHWNSTLISCLSFSSTMGSNSKKASRFHVFSFYGKLFFDWKHSWACRLKLSGCSVLLNAKWQLTDVVADKGTNLKMYPLFVYLFLMGNWSLDYSGSVSEFFDIFGLNESTAKKGKICLKVCCISLIRRKTIGGTYTIINYSINSGSSGYLTNTESVFLRRGF